jgi:hypothetical protein
MAMLIGTAHAPQKTLESIAPTLTAWTSARTRNGIPGREIATEHYSLASKKVNSLFNALAQDTLFTRVFLHSLIICDRNATRGRTTQIRMGMMT